MYHHGMLTVGLALAVTDAFLIPSSISLPALEISDEAATRIEQNSNDEPWKGVQGSPTSGTLQPTQFSSPSDFTVWHKVGDLKVSDTVTLPAGADPNDYIHWYKNWPSGATALTVWPEATASPEIIAWDDDVLDREATFSSAASWFAGDPLASWAPKATSVPYLDELEEAKSMTDDIFSWLHESTIGLVNDAENLVGQGKTLFIDDEEGDMAYGDDTPEGEYRSLFRPPPVRGGRSFSIPLNCTSCSFTPADESIYVDEDRPNTISMVWSMNADNSALLLNNVPVFPLSKKDTVYARQEVQMPYGPVFSKSRQLHMATSIDLRGPVDRLMFCIIALGVDEPLDTPDDDGCTMVILSRDGDFRQLVHVKLMSMDEFPPSSKPSDANLSVDNGCPAGPMLSVMMCRLQNAIKQKVADWKLLQPNPDAHREKHHRPCPGKIVFHEDGIDLPMHIPSPNDVLIHPPPIHGGPPKFMHHPGHNFEQDKAHYYVHQAGHIMHVLASAIRSFFFGFVIPVAIGIFAGIAASLLGMLVGSLVAYLWIKLVRGGKRGNATAGQQAREARVVDEEDVLADEKDGLLCHAPAFTEGEAPPLYAEKE